MKTLYGSSSPPSTINNLICSVGNNVVTTHSIFPILIEKESVIDIEINGRPVKINAETMSLNTGSEGLVCFSRHININQATVIVADNTGAVDIVAAKNIDPDKKVRSFSITSSSINVDGMALTFNAKGYLVGVRSNIQLNKHQTTAFLSDPLKGQILVTLAEDISIAIIKTILVQNEKNLEQLTVGLREAILEAIKTHYPNKNGYLNDSNIDVLAGKLAMNDDFDGLKRNDISSLINIVVNNYEHYERLYQSRRDNEGLTLM